VSRSGNQHRKFIPTDVFRTRDGYIYMAVGNDLQWRRLIEMEKFTECATPARLTNAGRHAERAAMFEDLKRVFARFTTEELARDLTRGKIPWAPVNDLYAVTQLPAVKEKVTRTRGPDGRLLALQPLPVDGEGPPRELTFAPQYGEHTRGLLREVGMTEAEIGNLIGDGTVYSSEPQSGG
jgi:crotonobetainyl-CoA:carnitine CoA-transferase CaiB-like acyl-CoA transferase